MMVVEISGKEKKRLINNLFDKSGDWTQNTKNQKVSRENDAGNGNWGICFSNEISDALSLSVTQSLFIKAKARD